MKHFKKICEHIDVLPILNILADNPNLWKEITIRQQYPTSCHKSTESIFLRGPKTLTHQDYFFDCGAYDYPAMPLFFNAISEILGEIMEHLTIKELGRMMLVKLASNSEVDPHIDEGTYADYFDRFHLAIKGNESNYLKVEDEKQHFKIGEVWQIDHKTEHSAHNPSNEPRIHLIFDAVI